MSNLKAYQSAAQQAQLDALVLVPGPNFARALNGSFMQHERPLLVALPAQGDPFAIVPNIEMSVFSELDFVGKVFDYTDQIGYQGAFDKAFQQTGFKKIGVEGLNMRVFVDQAIRTSLPQVQIIDAE
ncbi:MAG: aminopeptidase P family protein, partial [Actinobacteria bacterium]|nr:aminopeptidase P family protein [Actinomycetota bacterium]